MANLIDELIKNNPIDTSESKIKIGSTTLTIKRIADPLVVIKLKKKVKGRADVLVKGWKSLPGLKPFANMLGALEEQDLRSVFVQCSLLPEYIVEDITDLEFIKLYCTAYPIFEQIVSAVEHYSSSTKTTIELVEDNQNSGE